MKAKREGARVAQRWQSGCDGAVSAEASANAAGTPEGRWPFRPVLGWGNKARLLPLTDQPQGAGHSRKDHDLE